MLAVYTGASQLLRAPGEPVAAAVHAEGNHLRRVGAILRAAQQHFGLRIGVQASCQYL